MLLDPLQITMRAPSTPMPILVSFSSQHSLGGNFRRPK